MSSVNRKPTPNTSFDSPAASWRICASRSEPSLVSSVVNETPSSCLARSSPAYAASLKLLSPRPPMSNTSPTGNASPAAVRSGALPHPAAISSDAASSRAAAAGRTSGPVRMGLSRGFGRGARPATQVEAAAAAGLVDLRAAHDHAASALHFAVRAVGRRAAHDADGQRLGDVLGDREQLRHGLERAGLVVLVEPRHDHALAHARELLAHRHQLAAEELPLVDADDLRLVRVAQHLARALHRARRDAQLAVGDDGVPGVAVVQGRLEDLHPLARDLRPAQAADQLLGLAAVHAAHDDLDGAGPGQGARGFAHGTRDATGAPPGASIAGPRASGAGGVLAALVERHPL